MNSPALAVAKPPQRLHNRLKVGVFDYQASMTNPVGGCHLRMLRALCNECDFTVFSWKFDNPCPERIRWVRVPAPPRPLALLYMAYHVLAPIFYWADRERRKSRFDHVQMVESNLSFGDICYSQFCHRAYLKRHWKQSRPEGLRRFFRWLDHRLHALLEPWVYRRVRHIVIPSHGLARELASEYPSTKGKIHMIPNPVDVERLRPPEEFNRDEFRAGLGFAPGGVVLVFVALGAYERKGLPLVLEALSELGERRLRLLVVGGPRDLVAEYRSRVKRLGLQEQVVFTGAQRDVRPFLWAADAFAFPSFYEVFPLVALEAAAAGLPLLVSQLNGVEEFLRDGENGILLERTPEGVAKGIRRFLAIPAETRCAMGERACRDVQRYSTENFVAAWRCFYEGLDVA
jgi:glycosyltransferase involved in cell wall biosynthesis